MRKRVTIDPERSCCKRPECRCPFPSTLPSMPMPSTDRLNILILTVGSRGDVQPYVALGKGLRASGHTVTICTSERFSPFIREHGLAYAFMNDGFVEFMDTELSRQAMERMSNFRELLRYAPKLWRASLDIQHDLIRDGWAAARETDPDLILFHPKMYAAPHFAEKLQVPVAIPFVIPMSAPTSAFACPGFPAVPGLPDGIEAGYNRLTFHLVRWLTHLGTRSFVNDWRKRVGLSTSGVTTALHRSHTGDPIPVVYGFSRHLVPRPPDWPPHVEITGPWFLERDTGWEPPDDLLAFLDAGPPPVYVGFGSMAGRAPDRLARTVVRALRRTDARGILASGWGGLQTVDLPETIFAIDQVPHDWLFPRVTAVVHHGGAGTTAAGLRAGRPTVICPFMADQPFWGRRVHDAGAGPAPIPQTNLDEENLSAAICTATTDASVREAASRIGRGMRAEKGTARAVRAIERLVPGGRAVRPRPIAEP